MLAILAQANGGDPDDGLIIGLIVGVCAFYLAMLVVFIFFLLTLSRTLGRCRPRNRTMEPGMVWLNLIPLFNVVWMFITVVRLSESLRDEYAERGWHRRSEDYGQGLGIATCALSLASNIPYAGCLFFIGWVVCFIMYWVRMAGYGGQLASGGYDRYDDEDEDDRDDDRRRRDDRDDDRDDSRDDRKPWERR